jgi:hypothetical protein
MSKVVVESVFVPFERAIEVSSSEVESVSRSFPGFFVFEEVLVRGKVNEAEEVAINTVSDGLVAPDLVSLFVPCEGGIVMSLSESESVSRSVSVLFDLG